MEPIKAIRWKLFWAVILLGLVLPLVSCGGCLALGGGIETKPEITNVAGLIWLCSWGLGGATALAWVIYEIYRAVAGRRKVD